MILLELFWTFFKIGSMAFGGGWAILSLMEHEAVVSHAWLSVEQFRQVVYVAGFTPGPIAVSGSALIGQKVAGIPGAIASVLGLAIPSVVLPMILFFFLLKYGDNKNIKAILKGLGPIAIAMIAYVLFNLSKGVFANSEAYSIIFSGLLVVGGFVALYFKVNPIFVVLAGGLAGFFIWR